MHNRPRPFHTYSDLGLLLPASSILSFNHTRGSYALNFGTAPEILHNDCVTINLWTSFVTGCDSLRLEGTV